MTDVPALTAAMAILLAGGTLLAAAAAAASALDFAGAMRAAPLVGPLGRLALLLVGLALLVFTSLRLPRGLRPTRPARVDEAR